MTADWPPTFTIDTERVLRLFTGDRFYSSSDAALREAVLNAIDACGRRDAEEDDFTPSIRLVFDSDARTVTVADNGDGMARQQLQGLFTKVGASAAQLADQTARGQYKAVGEFGIGVVSYFLVSDRYQVHTLRAGQEQLGLEFQAKMLDGTTPALPVTPQRSEIGTTLIIFVKDESLFNHLLAKFPHWVRDVPGLIAVKQPGDVPLQQGGATTHVRQVPLTVPSWIERASLGPPAVFDAWNALDGRAHVDVLYRGVFVDRLTVERLWGIEGAIHVDPKQFKPKLNREGFVGGELHEQVTRFLQEVHPTIMVAAVDCLRDVLSDEKTREWTLLKWATLWLAVPRGGAYSAAAGMWDDQFRRKKAFRLLVDEAKSTDVSVADLQELKADKIFIAPSSLASASDVVKQAVRVLRARGLYVVQGVTREGGYLGAASLVAQSTSDLLIQYFREQLPQLVSVPDIAEQVVKEEVIAEVFDGPPRVRVVRLGPQGSPMVGVSNEIWLNADSDVGRRIIHDLCDRNEGLVGLWLAFLRHAPGHVSSVTGQLHSMEAAPTRLGPVRRQYLRKLAS